MQRHLANALAKRFHPREPEQIEAFLAEYQGLNLVLLYIIKGENLASGYPYWVFGYAYEKVESTHA